VATASGKISHAGSQMTKRIIIALIILAAGSAMFCTLQSATQRSQDEATASRQAWLMETQALAHAQLEEQTLANQVRELKENLATTPAVKALPDVTTLRTNHLSPAQREQLLEELGFNWNTSGDFLVVSKDTLRGVSLEALRGGQVTPVAANVLALTTDERR